ncbi:unnamed protein product [Polarella glacialis]|uniref:Uncharacterized protein n=1 Tax=Polarella glacialis TaxID=89957 RepID=A0A813DBT3_POLGL|nr:unnamed protein product [Polarella glacialis]
MRQQTATFAGHEKKDGIDCKHHAPTTPSRCMDSEMYSSSQAQREACQPQKQPSSCKLTVFRCALQAAPLNETVNHCVSPNRAEEGPCRDKAGGHERNKLGNIPGSSPFIGLCERL